MLPRLLMTTDAVGGIWTYSVDLGRALVSRGTRVTLALLGPPPETAARQAAAAAGLTLVGLPGAPEWLAADDAAVVRAGDALAEIAWRERVALIHLNHPALAARTRFGVPVLGLCHSCVATWWDAVKATPLPAEFRWRTDLVQQGCRAVQRLAAPSRAFAEATRRLYGLDAPPAVVRNGRAPTAMPSSDGAPVMAAFTAGRLWDEGKNAALMDRAAALMAAPFRAAGPTRGPNGASVALPHLDLLGSLDEAAMRASYAGRPIYVSAARYEPFGLSVLEAAQAGCALVLSGIDSLRELWSDAALFVAPDDARGFASAVERLLANPAQRAKLGRAAQARACAYTLDAAVDAVTTLYGNLLAGRSPEGRAA